MENLRFIQYRVEEMAFRRNDRVAAETRNFQIVPQIRVELKIEKENYFLILSSKVENTEEKPTPFDFSVKIFGQFVITQMTDIDSLRMQGTNFLYPYLRSTVSTMIVNAGMPPYFLPVIDAKIKPTAAPEREDGEIKITPLVDGDKL